MRDTAGALTDAESPAALAELSVAPLPPRTTVVPGKQSPRTGVPILVGPDGSNQALVRALLSPQGQGDFNEAWLQCFVHNNPACLPIEEIEPGLDHFFAVCRELKTARGYVDNLLMTGRGDITLVETKLFRNPEARRVVLAQILDYAACLFAMTYAEFQRAVLASSFPPNAKPTTLYEALPEAGKLGEAEFIDAVQHNLRRGRALLLVVGDGIRNDAERLLDSLQVHARFGFTLALIELAVFHMPGKGGFLIRPSTLAKTAITQRTVVEVSGAGIIAAREEQPVVAESLAADAYWEALESKAKGARAALEQFIRRVEPLGIYPEMLASLNLKWERSESNKPVNLGYIKKNGVFWMDASGWFVPKALAHAYVNEVAAVFGGEVHFSPKQQVYSVFRDGKPVPLSSMIGALDNWAIPMQRFIESIAKADNEAEAIDSA